MNPLPDHHGLRVNSGKPSGRSDVFEPSSANHSDYAEAKQRAAERFDSSSTSSTLSRESPTASMHTLGHKFHEVFQMKQGRYVDLSAAKISEMMKSNSLDNAPTQSLLSVVNGILDESIDRKNGEIPHRVASLLRKVVQEIERRISTQADHLRTQNNLFKAREEKYQSRIRVLEALASGTGEETGVAANQAQQLKNGHQAVSEEDMIKMAKDNEEKGIQLNALRQELEFAKRRAEDLINLMKEKEQKILELSVKQELAMVKRRDEDAAKSTQVKEVKDIEVAALRQELELAKRKDEDAFRLMKEKEQKDLQLSSLRQELEVTKRSRDGDVANLVMEKEQKDLQLFSLRRELEVTKRSRDGDVANLVKEKELKDLELSTLRKELEFAKRRDVDTFTLMKDKEQTSLELFAAKQELEMAKQRDEDALKLKKEKEQAALELSALRHELEMAKQRDEDMVKLMKEKEKTSSLELSALRQELEMAKLRDEDAVKLMKEKEQISALELSALRQELEMAKRRDEDAVKLMKEKEQTSSLELSALRQELEMAKRRDEDAVKLMKEKEQTSSLELSALRQELEMAKRRDEDAVKLMKEKEQIDLELSSIRQELEMAKRTHEMRRLELETDAKVARIGLETRMQELQLLLDDSRNKATALEAESESRIKTWEKKKRAVNSFVSVSSNAFKELRSSSKSIKHEILKAEKYHSEDLKSLGSKLKALIDSTENYHLVVAENRKLFNELQDLKGNIRVYCRVRPFLPGQVARKTIVEYVGENGELVVANPSKQGKEARRMFRFNKCYGPTATQAEVFTDTQPLIRTVLDGFNVCIFAYGQTGSGKTYTMTGPDGASPEDWGVNYRALNDLFGISQKRRGSFVYEVGVQMVEIYNEQVRDLLSSDSQKKLGIVSATQSNGVAVPDASMHSVSSTTDVLTLMNVGLKNRAVGATAMNDRSSRSHSVVSIHVRGKDMNNGASSFGNLHLVDLAGSERVDRSEVTGDRLKEAQHINKSLSALGDVIFSLAQKSSHVPYRNSKLTQLLQTSLGGRAKTLMFVQLNPDIDSYSESMSTLKFAERVSGVELGAAKSSKDGRDVKELMDQVASLKDMISRKDDEIDRLQVVRGAPSEKLGTGSLRSGYTSPSYESLDAASQRNLKPLSRRSSADEENFREFSGRHSETSSQQSMDDFRRVQWESKSAGGDQDNPSEILDYGDADSEGRLSDISDEGLSVGAESDAATEVSEKSHKQSKVASRIRSLQKATGQTTRVSVSRDSVKASTSVKRTNNPASSAVPKLPTATGTGRRWQ